MIATLLSALVLATPCHATGAAPFVLPDNVCTPGAFAPLTHAEVCTSKDRPSTPAAVRRQVLRNYGVPAFSGTAGEIDHRQPFFLGGLTIAANLWPERGSRPNPKDRLEDYVRRRICTRRPHPMSVRAGHAVFAGNWIAYYRYYIAGVGARPAP